MHVNAHTRASACVWVDGWEKLIYFLPQMEELQSRRDVTVPRDKQSSGTWDDERAWYQIPVSFAATRNLLHPAILKPD